MNSFLLTQIAFAALTIIAFWVLTKELFKVVDSLEWEGSKKKKFKTVWTGSLLTWAVFVSAWSLSGTMRDFEIFPFNFMPVLIIPLVVTVALTLSNSFLEILQRIPKENIIRLQSFRFFVELLLWFLFIQNLLPEQMSFEGRNFDVIAGATAPLISWLVYRGKLSNTLLIVWNVACLGLLINIVTIAILSMPSPFRVFMEEPANTIVAYFPISWLPGLLVPLAYMLHFFSLKQIIAERAGVARQLA